MKPAQKRHKRRANKRAAKGEAAKEVAEKATALAAIELAAGPSYPFPVVGKRIKTELAPDLATRDIADLLALWWHPDPTQRQRVTLGAIIDGVQEFERKYLESSRAAVKANKPVTNPGLIDVWRNYSTFVVESVSPEEAGWGHLCFGPAIRPSPEEASTFASLKTELQSCGAPNTLKKNNAEAVTIHATSSSSTSASKESATSSSSTSASKESVGALPSSVLDLVCSYALQASVVERDTFLQRFSVFTSRQFEGWTDWSNMLVIGGAVVACLLPFEKEQPDLHDYYFNQNDCWTSSDIDVYFWGLTDQEFGKKVFDLYRHLLKRNGKVAVMRTPFTVTFVSDWPARNIQIVLGKWASQAQILMEPDVDCSAVGFDGSRVWATERSRLSYNHRWLLASQERYDLRGFPEYEERLYKYSRRGFAIVDRELEGDFSNVSKKYMDIGVTRLMEHKVIRGRAYVLGLRLLFLGAFRPEIRASVDLFKIEKYKSCGIPYGPNWNVDNVCTRMMEPVYETTHYGPNQVESRFTVLKPHEDGGEVPAQLAVSQPTFTNNWYRTEEEEKKLAAERAALPKSVATQAYFTNEIKLVNLETEAKPQGSYYRHKPQWNTHVFKYQEDRENEKDHKRERRQAGRLDLYKNQLMQCAIEGYCLSRVKDHVCYSEDSVLPDVVRCDSCAEPICKPCILKKCHGPACKDMTFRGVKERWRLQCRCKKGSCKAYRPEKYPVPRNLEYSSDDTREHSDSP